MKLENKEKLIQAYENYLSKYESVELSCSYMPYGWVKMPESMDVDSMAFAEFIKEYASELANEINTFRTYIHRLSAWSKILATCDDKEKMSILSEFVEPVAICAFNHPYSIRFRFIFSVSHISHQANKSVEQENWNDDLKSDRNIDFKEMERKSNKWKCYPEFKSTLSKINDEHYNESFMNFRHKFNHRFPPLIELGISGLVTRNKHDNGCISYGFGHTNPIRLSDAVPILVDQHNNMKACFSSFQKLINEQVSSVFKT